MKLVVLDAGDSFELDGFNKLLIKHPKYKKTIIQLYKEYFNVDKIEIVVGFKAIQIINEYPEFQYVFNKKWQTTGSGYSLSLTLDDEPCYVVSSDFIINKQLTEDLDKFDNCAIINYTENRRISSLNAVISTEGYIKHVYRGKSKNNDPELLGIFKISDNVILKKWKKNCIDNPQFYAGETLPLSFGEKIKGIDVSNYNIYEINTPEDYIKFINSFTYEK